MLKINLFPRGKKGGSLAIGITTILVFLAVFVALFAMTQSERTIPKVYSIDPLDKVNVREDFYRFYIRQAGKKAVEGLSEESFNEDLFRARFESEFESYDFEEVYLNDLKNNILQGLYSVEKSNEKIRVSIGNLFLKESGEKITVTYNLEVEEEFILES